MAQSSDLKTLFHKILVDKVLIQAILSSPFSSDSSSKACIRPLTLKGKEQFQLTEQKKNQVFHQNFSSDECLAWFLSEASLFKQMTFQTKEADYQVLQNKKGTLTILKKPATKLQLENSHNRKKEYVWHEEDIIPFLVALGITDSKGRVLRAKADKYRQINRFLEMVEDCLVKLGPICKTLNIIDFGCGKSYLTFALYHFLKVTKGLCVNITGIDLKEEVVKNCNTLAHQLKYGEDLRFVCGLLKITLGAKKELISSSLCTLVIQQQMQRLKKPSIGKRALF